MNNAVEYPEGMGRNHGKRRLRITGSKMAKDASKDYQADRQSPFGAFPRGDSSSVGKTGLWGLIFKLRKGPPSVAGQARLLGDTSERRGLSGMAPGTVGGDKDVYNARVLFVSGCAVWDAICGRHP